MNRIVILIIISVLTDQACLGQNDKVQQLKECFASLDLDCYARMIERDMAEFNKWQNDTLYPTQKEKPIIGNVNGYPLRFTLNPEYKRKQYKQLPKNTKIVFALCVCFSDMQDFLPNQDIYDHIIIDSTLMVRGICINRKGNVIGITDWGDYGAIGTFNDVFYSTYKTSKKQFHRIYKDLKKRHAELILFIDYSPNLCRILYARDGQLYFFKQGELEIPIEEEIIRKAEQYPNYWQIKNYTKFPSIRERFREEVYKTAPAIICLGHTSPSCRRICN